MMAVANQMELVGVRNRGCRRANQAGTSWSQPAVMGRRGDAGEDEAGGAEDPELHEQNGGGGECARGAAVAECHAEGLGDGRGVVDGDAGVELVKSDDGAGSEDEHGADEGRGDPDGAADVALRGFGFAGEDGDVLEAGECAEHLAHERDGDEVGVRQVHGERHVMDRRVVRQRPERRGDEQAEDQEHGAAAEVVNPFAEGEAAIGCERERTDEHGEHGEDGSVVFGQPSGARADHVGELFGDLEEDGGDGGHAVGPDVPRGHEAGGVSEGGASPDVEAAFEGHLAVEVIDADGHRQVEHEHRGDPHDGLRAAEAGGDAHPGAADDGEDLGEDQVAQGKLPREPVALQMHLFGYAGQLRRL